jgi:hypothetical protein
VQVYIVVVYHIWVYLGFNTDKKNKIVVATARPGCSDTHPNICLSENSIEFLLRAILQLIECDLFITRRPVPPAVNVTVGENTETPVGVLKNECHVVHRCPAPLPTIAFSRRCSAPLCLHIFLVSLFLFFLFLFLFLKKRHCYCSLIAFSRLLGRLSTRLLLVTMIS